MSAPHPPDPERLASGLSQLQRRILVHLLGTSTWSPKLELGAVRPAQQVVLTKALRRLRRRGLVLLWRRPGELALRKERVTGAELTWPGWLTANVVLAEDGASS